MAQKSGFFNALRVNGIFDRKYNANDYSDNLAVVISNGVLRSENDDLKVTSSGMVTTVAAGRAWINGHYYLNDSPLSFAAVSAPIGGARWDRVFLRLNKEVLARSISLVYVQGVESNSPVKPTPTRTDSVFDLVLADVYVGTNATSVIVTDTRADKDLCGWVYSTSGDDSFFTSLDNAFYEWFEETKDTMSSVTLFKRYNWRTVLQSATKTVIFNIPQWDAETAFLEVYVNGILDHENVDYTLNGSTLTFAGTLTAGTEVIVKVYKSIDGTGIETVADEITELQNQVAALNKSGEYEYICNGVNDNVLIGNIIRDYLNTDTSGDYGTMKLNVIGTIGMSAPAYGSGTTANPYGWFNFNIQSNRNAIVDFTRCSQIAPPIASGTYNHIFHANNDIHVIGANVVANNTATDTVIRISGTSSGVVRFDDCRFWITAYKDSLIALRGTFNNCRGSVANVTNNSYCFLPSGSGIVRINGGEYYAYCGASNLQSAVVGQSSANAVSILYGVNAPTVARSGFYQTNSLLQWTGGGMINCTDLVSALPLVVVAGISNIRGTIALSKAGAM